MNLMKLSAFRLMCGLFPAWTLICVCARMRAYECLRVYMHACVCMCVHLCVHMHVVYVCGYKCAGVYTLAYMYM